MDVSQNILQFKIQMMRHFPFYGDILMRLPIREDDAIGTAATDSKEIIYSPRFFGTLSPGEQHFILMHEVLHVLLRHSQRKKDSPRERQLWNVACDLIVNDMLVSKLVDPMCRAGIPCKMPSKVLHSALPHDTTVENLYQTLKNQNWGSREDDPVKVYVRRYRYGSGNGNVTEIQPPGDLLNEESDEDQHKIDEQRMKKMITEALREHGGNGYSTERGSYFIPDAVYELYRVKPLNWRKLFRDMLDPEIGDDTSYATPERKYLHMDLILPGHSTEEETLDEVWIFVDSSGSISKQTMADFLTQVHSIIRSFRCVMNIAYWDTAVTDVYRKIRDEKQLAQCLPHHSGGTNLNCVYQWMEKNRVRPSKMVILTDGDFAPVQVTGIVRRMRRNTILILTDTVRNEDSLKQIGKIARLTE